ncbi:hypothetical protein Val02_85770 [Virgisporangium aliadipatigenens]|uniref:Uncharacterized protein n=1 Tax=Virgisporangium aliadipatigenens TaxID=741659 RepID=A0A8J3YUD0_9ACTN|nr:hypothetical protein [Virgisporangium aliadipatigenens]GIJ51691.1 hypothetical protein Val02_85770 [Virgisporangium aliadipatigenens]
MRVHRLLLVLATAATALFIAAPAGAAPSADPSTDTSVGPSTDPSTNPYPDNTPQTNVDKPAVAAGGQIEFSGTGFWPFEEIAIDVTFTSTTAGLKEHANGAFVVAGLPVPRDYITSVQADGNGSFSVMLDLEQVGTAILKASGAQSGAVLTETVTVVAAAATTTSSAQLAVTGLNPRVGTEVIGGAAAIAVGAFLVWFAFRKRRRGQFES